MTNIEASPENVVKGSARVQMIKGYTFTIIGVLHNDAHCRSVQVCGEANAKLFSWHRENKQP